MSICLCCSAFSNHLSLWMGFSLNPEALRPGGPVSTCMPQTHILGRTPFQAHMHACNHTHTPAITHTHLQSHTQPPHACLHCLSHTHTPVSLWARRWDTARAPSFWDLRFRIWALGPSWPCFLSMPPCCLLASASPSLCCLAVTSPERWATGVGLGSRVFIFYRRAYHADQRTLNPELFTEFVSGEPWKCALVTKRLLWGPDCSSPARLIKLFLQSDRW